MQDLIHVEIEKVLRRFGRIWKVGYKIGKEKAIYEN
jgi:hypothetical protein